MGLNNNFKVLTYLWSTFEWRQHQQRPVRTANNNKFFKPHYSLKRFRLTQVFPFQCDVRSIDSVVELKKKYTLPLWAKHKSNNCLLVNQFKNLLKDLLLIQLSNSAQSTNILIVSKRNSRETSWTIQIALLNLQVIAVYLSRRVHSKNVKIHWWLLMMSKYCRVINTKHTVHQVIRR